MPDKVKTSRILLLIYGWLQIIVGAGLLLLFLLLSFFIGISGEEGAIFGSLVFSGFGFIIAIFVGGMGIVDLLAARGLSQGKDWGRILSIVLAVFMLTNFPLGTVFGILILIYLLDQESADYFSGKKE